MVEPVTPSKDFSTRFTAAKKLRDDIQHDIEDALAFISPGREKDFDRRYDDSTEEDPEVFMSLPEDLATDFAADMVTYFCPPEAIWAEYTVIAPVPEDQVEAVKGIVETRETAIHELIQSSNFNDVAPQVFFEANHGTIAMWVEQAHMTQPIHVEAVTPDELYIVPGHLGILDRFREKWCRAEHLKLQLAKYPGVDMDGETMRALTQKKDAPVKVCYGFWLNWEDPGNPIWMCEITVDGKSVMMQRDKQSQPVPIGPLEGGCPLLVGRFNPQKRNPWGRGPARKALPDLRVLNRVDERVLEGLDQALTNTLIYASDGFLDFGSGLEPGKAYAAHRGFTSNSVYELNRGVNLDTGFFSQERLEERLRACFYQDGPRQRGDTPPTAAQWLDERRRVQQRIGKPSAPLWRELLLPFIQRVERIGVEMQRFDAEITHDGDVLNVLPISPLQKASNQDKVLIARSNLELAFSIAQDQTATVVDLVGTFKNIVEASGDELTVVFPEQQAPNEPPPPE